MGGANALLNNANVAFCFRDMTSGRGVMDSDFQIVLHRVQKAGKLIVCINLVIVMPASL